MRRGGLLEQCHWGKTFIYKVVSFYIGFGLSGGRQVEQVEQGGQSPGEQGAGEGSIWGRKAGAEI